MQSADAALSDDTSKRFWPDGEDQQKAAVRRFLLPSHEVGVQHPQEKSGVLFLVPTPIGNPEDISLRALRVLREVHAIVAEDPRVTSELLRCHQLETPLFRLGNHGIRPPELMQWLREGRQVALVCDAGTPGIADPGTAVVHTVLSAGHQVESLPGPTAVIVALTASGLPTQRFAFDGFAPRARSDREAFFAALAREQRTLVLFETTGYLKSTLVALKHHLSAARQITISFDLTTPRASVWRGTLGEAVHEFQAGRKRGRYTLTIQGAVGSVAEPIKNSCKTS